MATYAYRAKNQSGTLIEGRYEATDQSEAVRVLREQGLSILNLRIEGSEAERIEAASRALNANSSKNFPNAAPIKTDFRARANAKEISLFFRQIHAMLNAGTGISRALKSLSSHAPNAGLRRAAETMSRQTGEGQLWSATMRAYPALFSPLMIAMIEAGERGGFLVSMCQRIAEYSERDFELQQAIRREVFYPKILVAASIFIPSVVTLVISGLGAWLAQIVPIVLFCAIVFCGWKILQRVLEVSSHTHFLPLWFDTFKLRLPAFGKTMRALATAKFCRALATLYAAGVGPRHAFSLAGAASGNRRVAEETRRVAPMLENGATFSELLTRTRLFSPLALQMLAVGEESGAIDKQMDKTADFLEAEAETSIRQSVKVGGVLIFLVIAVYIAFIVGSMYMGYASEITKMIE